MAIHRITSTKAEYVPGDIYFMETLAGVDLFLAQADTSLRRLNCQSQINGNGRVYCQVDKRWISNSDDNYGVNYYQMNESGGTGVDPIIEWEHLGDIVTAGTLITGFVIAGFTNHTEVSDLEICLVKKKPNPITRWESGIDNDGEVNGETMYRDFFYNNSEPEQPAFSGATNDIHLRQFSIPESAGYIDETSMLTMYVKPVGVLTATRYFRMTNAWLMK